MRRVLVLVSFLLCATIDAASYRQKASTPTKLGATTCGTCSSLGYQCVGAHPPNDTCGHPLDPATCDVPSCADYCRTMFAVTEGSYCDDSLHMCQCDTAPPIVLVPSPIQVCARPLCDRLQDIFSTCIPAHFLDACTNASIRTDACPTTRPACNVSCPCAVDGSQCFCGNVSDTVVLPAPDPAPDPVPTPVTVRTPAPAYVMGTGGIIGVCLTVLLGLLLEGALVVDYTQRTDVRTPETTAGVPMKALRV